MKLYQPAIIGNKQEAVKQKYDLLMNYPDPFRLSKEPEFSDKQINVVNKSAESIPITESYWPEIKYSGFVSSGETVHVHLTYNGLKIILKQGELFGEQFKVVTITKDSILITMGHEKQWFKK